MLPLNRSFALFIFAFIYKNPLGGTLPLWGLEIFLRDFLFFMLRYSAGYQYFLCKA
jgi:hypothetical protein